MSSGGVGYFEYEVTVDGNATLNLDVPIDQVDDILKSLVVYDDSGTAGEITLPGREPLTQSFVDLPFDRTALESAPALLNALLRFCRPRSATPVSVIPDEIVSGAARPKHARICPT